MIPIVGYPTPPPPGLNETIEAAGYAISNVGGVYMTNSEASAQAIMLIVASYDPLMYVRAQKLAEASTMKEFVEEGGITTSGGIPLDTSAGNQLRLLRLACSTEANPLPQSFAVKDRNGVFHLLTRAEARILGSDINAFFQSCLSGEASAVTAINDPQKTWQQVWALDIRAFFPANS